MADDKKSMKSDGRPKKTRDVVHYFVQAGVRGVKLLKGPDISVSRASLRMTGLTTP